ncbi:4-diphosphocytidyl-2C-methyl-D-erythritol kinase [Rhizobium albus]|nr:4-diphosphocytidyl-2C-methyl-D-erythritol kinase [Rhizobium albus]
MRFAELPIDEAEDALLAHSVKQGAVRLRKGHRLTAQDVADLDAAGVSTVFAVTLDAGDEPEDAAAARLGAALHADNVAIGEAATGRVNIFAAAAGLFRVEAPAVDALNRVDPAITFACLKDRSPVNAGDMVATIKIIPLAVAGPALAEATMAIAHAGLIGVTPFRAAKVGLIATTLPSLKPSVMDKTRGLLEARLRPSGSTLLSEKRVAHETGAVAAALRETADPVDILIVFGASAVADPHDVIPEAIRQVGGVVEAVGMPVDPGNLLVLGAIAGKPVIGAPGCARSPKENGFDWVLARILAGETVTRADIAGMGVGGLLTEIASRPQPRIPRTQASLPTVGGVLLAAGKASRMGIDGAHKLLAEFDGEALVRRTARAGLNAGLTPMIAVTGHRAGEVEAALAGLDLTTLNNAAFASGMASSLKAGIAALGGEVGGAIILLADMPGIGPGEIGTLVDAFQHAGGEAIVRAASGEKRGNPVILPRSTFDAVLALEGDVGARQIVETSGLHIIDVDIGQAAQLDVDTPEAVAAAGGVLKA